MENPTAVVNIITIKSVLSKKEEDNQVRELQKRAIWKMTSQNLLVWRGAGTCAVFEKVWICR